MELVFRILGYRRTDGIRRVSDSARPTFPVVVGLTPVVVRRQPVSFRKWSAWLPGQQPIIGTAGSYSDPLPQALVLTAIVIGSCNDCVLRSCCPCATWPTTRDEPRGRQTTLQTTRT